MDDAPPLVGVRPDVVAVAMLMAIGDLPRMLPKPRARFYQDGRMLFMCGWCRGYSAPEDLRLGILTGNNWPIHRSCYIEWYDNGEPPRC